MPKDKGKLVIKSLQGKAPSGGPWYWTGDTWGELAWAATYTSEHDLPDHVGPALLSHDLEGWLNYRKPPGGEKVAIVERLQYRSDLQSALQRHCIKVECFIESDRLSKAHLAQWLSDLISTSLPDDCTLVQGEVKGSTIGQAGTTSVTVSPLVLEPAKGNGKPKP